jgi:hypothetical protein
MPTLSTTTSAAAASNMKNPCKNDFKQTAQTAAQSKRFSG